MQTTPSLMRARSLPASWFYPQKIMLPEAEPIPKERRALGPGRASPGLGGGSRRAPRKKARGFARRHPMG
jgi:hypothetical protein